MKTKDFNYGTFLGTNDIVRLPERCDGLWNRSMTTHIECGFEYEIDNLLGVMKCTNKNCPCRIHSQIYGWARRNSITELTHNELVNFLDSWSCTSPYDIFCYRFDTMGVFSDSTDEETSKVIEGRLRQEFDIVDIANIVIGTPNIDTLRSILSGYTLFSDFYEELDKGGLLWLYERGTGFDLESKVEDLYEKIVVNQDDEKVRSVCKLVAEKNSDALYKTLKESGVEVLRDAMLNHIESVDLSIITLYEKFLTYREDLLSVDGNINIAKSVEISSKEV